MRQPIDVIRIFFQAYIKNIKVFVQPLLDSLKQGLTVFVALLILLALMELFVSVFQTKPASILDSLDIATAFVGSALMFAAKFLKELSSKR